MKNATTLFGRFAADERGLETVEYAIMTALIITAIVVALVALAGAISTRIDTTRITLEGI